jgi:streptogramin lyase
MLNFSCIQKRSFGWTQLAAFCLFSLLLIGCGNTSTPPQSTITAFKVPAAGLGPGITAGPDGALWLTDSAGSKIGRITLQGAFTSFPIPTTESNPQTITAGPDGALWFTESNGFEVGHIKRPVSP